LFDTQKFPCARIPFVGASHRWSVA
jgi:hypothetical protein